MNIRQIFWPSNLLSLARVFLIIPLWYSLSIDSTVATLASLGILVVAGITDFLDGYLARRMGQISTLGAALDPIADKIFAGLFTILLITYRDFPLWLAIAMVGRDLALLTGGLVLLKRGKPTIPARLYGKYLFFATVVLLGSYVLRYEFGELLSIVCVLALCLASLLDYGRVFARVQRGEDIPPFNDSPRWRTFRVGLTATILLIYAIGWIVKI